MFDNVGIEICVKKRYCCAYTTLDDGAHMEDGELIEPPNFESWRCASFVFVSSSRKSGSPARGRFHDLCRVFEETKQQFFLQGRSRSHRRVSGSSFHPLLLIWSLPEPFRTQIRKMKIIPINISLYRRQKLK